MMVQVGIFAVCLALAAYYGVKTAQVVQGVAQERSRQKEGANAPTDEEKRKADQKRREMENFMKYNGTPQEGYDGN